MAVMGRWEPGARARLEQAAMELYAERGFDETTVAEIARRAGLTERTFFRHFGDKREVLFGGSEGPLNRLASEVADASVEATPIEAAAAGLMAVGAVIQERRGREGARARQAILAQNPELQERELIKMAAWAAVVARALRGRGVADPSATLTAEVALAAFRVAFGTWVGPGNQRDLPDLIRESFDRVTELAAGSSGRDGDRT